MEAFLEGIKWGLIFIASVGIFFFVFVFTFVREGTAKAVVKFGEFHKLMLSYEGRTFDDQHNVIPGGIKNIFGGLRFVGIRFIHSIHKYHFQWTSWSQVEEDGEIVDKPIFNGSETLDYILLQDDVYYTLLDKAECAERVPLNIALLLTLRIVNPYKAMFRVQQWLEMTINRIKPAARDYVGSKKYEELVSESQDPDRNVITELFEELEPIRNAVLDAYGVEVAAITIPKVDPASDLANEFLEASTKLYVAKMKHEETIELADAEVARLKKVYDQILEYDESGLKLRAMEMLEKASQKEGNWIIPVSSLEGLISGLLAGATNTRRRQR